MTVPAACYWAVFADMFSLQDSQGCPRRSPETDKDLGWPPAQGHQGRLGQVVQEQIRGYRPVDDCSLSFVAQRFPVLLSPGYAGGIPLLSRRGVEGALARVVVA
jgi:hypothetical protein